MLTCQKTKSYLEKSEMKQDFSCCQNWKSRLTKFHAKPKITIHFSMKFERFVAGKWFCYTGGRKNPTPPKNRFSPITFDSGQDSTSRYRQSIPLTKVCLFISWDVSKTFCEEFSSFVYLPKSSKRTNIFPTKSPHSPPNLPNMSPTCGNVPKPAKHLMKMS